MSVYHKTPMARKAAWSYCRRCLAVMLCCVLVFGLTMPVTPRAKANAAVGAIEIIGAGSGGGVAAAGALGSNPVGAAIGGILLAAVGTDFVVGYWQHDETMYYGNAPYELGGQCWDYLYGLGGDIADWCMSRSASDVQPGATFDVPSEVAAAVQQWAVDNISFDDGSLVVNQHGLFDADGNAFLFTAVDVSGVTNWSPSSTNGIKVPLVRMGNNFIAHRFPAWDESQVYPFSVGPFLFEYAFNLAQSNGRYSYDYIFRYNVGKGTFSSIASNSNNLSHGVSISDLASVSAAMDSSFEAGSFWSGLSPVVLAYSSANDRVYLAAYNLYDGFCYLNKNNYVPLSALSDGIFSVSTTATATPALGESLGNDLVTLRVPDTMVTAQVGDVTIPVIEALTQADVLVGEGEDDPPVVVPGTGGLTKGDVTGAVSDAISNTMPGVISDAITDALPITGAIAGDAVVADTLAEPDDLGAVFVSKFPFSIPWDIYKFFTLLAADPVTPHWEIDFYGPLEGVGGFHAQGDTTLVIDFGSLDFMGQVCRWTCLAGFIYALASGTKRLIWTA